MPDGKLFIHEARPAEWAGHARRFLQRAAVRAAARRPRAARPPPDLGTRMAASRVMRPPM
jgi:hypothetical protein